MGHTQREVVVVCYEGRVRILAAVALFACACNSAPKSSCTPSTDGVISAAAVPATCPGTCVDAGEIGSVCLVDCTDGGDAVCGGEDSGAACAAVSVSTQSFCLPRCVVSDGGDAASCLPPLACNDAGVCTL